jgi:hypothetical protein
MGLAVEEMVLGRLPPNASVPLSNLITPTALYSYPSPSGAGAMGPIVADLPSGLSLVPSHK